MKKSFSSRKKISRRLRWAAIISAALFIISLVGLIIAQNLPTEIEKETTLFSYEHRGRFDYLVYLKSSYLFGPIPEEPPPLPSNPKYPVELIDSVDMSFRYETNSEVTGGVEIKAVLQNSDIWQKDIIIVPVTDKTGDFKIDFELDLDELNRVFDTIESETGIRASSRLVTIVARVGLGEGLESEFLKQSLPMELSKNILEVSSDRIKTLPGIRGTFDYTIHLKENSLYKTDTLIPSKIIPYSPPSPTTVGPETVIPYTLVDKMDTTFSYYFSTSHQVRKLAEEVTIKAIIENPEVWSKTFTLVPTTTKIGDFSVDFTVDVDHLQWLLDTIRNEADIPSENYKLSLKAIVHTMAETDFGTIDETFTQTLTSDVEKGTLEWEENQARSQAKAITDTEVIPNPDRYLWLSVDRLRLVSIILSSIFLTLIIASVVYYNKFKPAGPSLIEKEIIQTGKKYRDRIAEASSQTPIAGDKIIALGSMEDLVKVADELGKPVIHQPPSASVKGHTYYVLDGITLYQYVIPIRSKERRSHAGKSEWS